jgi:hypothetical protein
MDSRFPVAVPSPHKSRRGWLIAFGVIEILIGCSFLLMILFSVIAFLGPWAAPMPSSPISPHALMALLGLHYGLLAGVFFTGGIGSIRCKNWARILMLVISGLWLGLGLVATLILAVTFPTILQRQAGNLPPGVRHAFVVGVITVVTALMLLLPAIFLFFYSRSSVRATCLALKGAQAATPEAGATPAPGLPVPLVILVVWQGFSAFSMLGALLVPAAVVFGVVVRGAGAFLVFLTHSVLSGYAAWAIFRQKLIGWQVALFTTSFWAISWLVGSVRRPNLLQLLREMGFADEALRFYEQSPHALPLLWMVSIVVMIGFLAFLLYTRKFFPTEEGLTRAAR